jgi:hypothetical protein
MGIQELEKVYVERAGEFLPDLSKADRVRIGRFASAVHVADLSAERAQIFLINPCETSEAVVHSTFRDEELGRNGKRALRAAQAIAGSRIAWRVTMNENLGGPALLPAPDLAERIKQDRMFQARNRRADHHPEQRELYLLRQGRILGCTALAVAGRAFNR